MSGHPASIGTGIVEVTAGTPAPAVGPAPGDLIVSLGGHAVTSAAGLRSAIDAIMADTAATCSSRCAAPTRSARCAPSPPGSRCWTRRRGRCDALTAKGLPQRAGAAAPWRPVAGPRRLPADRPGGSGGRADLLDVVLPPAAEGVTATLLADGAAARRRHYITSATASVRIWAGRCSPLPPGSDQLVPLPRCAPNRWHRCDTWAPESTG